MRQLASHTSGLALLVLERRRHALGAGDGHAERALRQRGRSSPPRWSPTPARRYEYGINTDWLGRVVEAASGSRSTSTSTEHILKPLGMEHTAFAIGDEQRANLVPIHLRGEDGAWAATEIDWAPRPRLVGRRPRPVFDPARLPALPAHAAHSGTLDGVQILRARDGRRGLHATRSAASTSRSGSRPPTRPRAPTSTAGPDYKFGLGLLLNVHDMPGARKRGSGAWAGLFNTHFWVDREDGRDGRDLLADAPVRGTARLQVYMDFEKALYASLWRAARAQRHSGRA